MLSSFAHVKRPGPGVIDGSWCLFTRPSKLRLSTLATTRSPFSIPSEIACGSGPELLMQVVQP